MSKKIPPHLNDVYKALKQEKLTALDWAQLSGSTKLTSRVSDLRSIGVRVFDKWITLRSEKKIKQYWI